MNSQQLVSLLLIVAATRHVKWVPQLQPAVLPGSCSLSCLGWVSAAPMSLDHLLCAGALPSGSQGRNEVLSLCRKKQQQLKQDKITSPKLSRQEFPLFEERKPDSIIKHFSSEREQIQLRVKKAIKPYKTKAPCGNHGSTAGKMQLTQRKNVFCIFPKKQRLKCSQSAAELWLALPPGCCRAAPSGHPCSQRGCAWGAKTGRSGL